MRGCTALSSKQLNTGSQCPATIEPRAAWPGQRGVGLACWEGEPRASGFVLPTRPRQGSQLDWALSLALGRHRSAVLEASSWVVNPSPPPYIPPHSHLPAVYKALSQCDLICHSSTPRGRKGKVGRRDRRGCPPRLGPRALHSKTHTPHLSVPVNSQFLGGSS